MLDSRGILQSVASKNDYDDTMAKLKEFGLNEYSKFCFGNERSEFPKRRGSDVSGIPSSFPKQAERGFRSGAR